MELEVIPCMSRPKAASKLRDCLEHGKVIPIKHFRDELANEGISFQDAHDVLRLGIIYDPPEEDTRTGEWRYRIEGNEPVNGWR